MLSLQAVAVRVLIAAIDCVRMRAKCAVSTLKRALMHLIEGGAICLFWLQLAAH